MTEPMKDDGIGPAQPVAWYEANPQARISSTRMAAYRRCPSWYRYQYLEWHRTWILPVMRAGHMVQTALERVFDSRPAGDVSMEALERRALDRALASFDELWMAGEAEHRADPGSLGAFDVPRERYEAMIAQGIRFHLLEVRARLERRHPRTKDALALSEIQSAAQAWIEVRPWHPVKKSDDDLALDVIPRGFFQGQYDLVYTWTGGRRIIDLKASKGKSLFSSEIEAQLLSYAWMEREWGRRVEGLEGWFLGQDAPTSFPVPDDAEMDAFARRVVALIATSGSEQGYDGWRAQDFEPLPETGVPGFPPAPGEPSPWCGVCPAAFTCPKSSRKAPPVGQSFRFDQLSPRATTAEGLVLGVGEARTKNGKSRRRVTLANDSGAMSFGFDVADVDRMAKSGLRAGHVVRVTGLSPWTPPSGDRVMWFSSRGTRAELLQDSWAGLPSDPETTSDRIGA